MNRTILFSILGLVGIGLLASAFFLTTSSSTKPTPELRTITVGGNAGVYPFNTLAYIGTQEGIFAKHRIHIETESITTNVSVAGLLSNSLQYSTFQKEAATASLQGAPVSAVIPLSSVQNLYLVSRPGIAPEEIATVGVLARHSLLHYFALVAMERHGFTAEIVESGGNSTALRAMLSEGRVDAIIVGLPAPFLFAEEGFVVVDTFSDITLPSTLIATRVYAAENQDEIRELAAAFAETAAFVSANEAKTTEYLRTLLALPESTSAETLAHIYATTEKILRTRTPDPHGMDTMIQIGKSGAFTTLSDITSQTVTQEDRDAVFSFITP